MINRSKNVYISIIIWFKPYSKSWVFSPSWYFFFRFRWKYGCLFILNEYMREHGTRNNHKSLEYSNIGNNQFKQRKTNATINSVRLCGSTDQLRNVLYIENCNAPWNFWYSCWFSQWHLYEIRPHFDRTPNTSEHIEQENITKQLMF